MKSGNRVATFMIYVSLALNQGFLLSDYPGVSFLVLKAVSEVDLVWYSQLKNLQDFFNFRQHFS